MTQTLIDRPNLAKRWGFENHNSLIAYENEGIITRNTNFKAPRYYMEEVLKIEALGEVNPLSPLERKRLEKRISDLEKENQLMRERLNNCRMALGL